MRNINMYEEYVDAHGKFSHSQFKTSQDKINFFKFFRMSVSTKTFQDWYDGGSSTPTPRIEAEKVIQDIQTETSSEDRSPFRPFVGEPHSTRLVHPLVDWV